jgi:hypothetical protein
MWYCNTRLMRSSGDRYNSVFGKALRAISLACSPGTILYTSRSNILSRLQTTTRLIRHIKKNHSGTNTINNNNKVSYLMLNSGRVLCSCTSHIGQKRLVSKYLTMQDRQTVQKQIDAISTSIILMINGVTFVTVTTIILKTLTVQSVIYSRLYIEM